MKNRDEIIDYVFARSSVRPKTSIFKAIKYVVLFLLSIAVASSVCYLILSSFDAFLYLPDGMQKWISAHPVWHKVIYVLLWYILGIVCVAKKACIGMVRLYQRYSPEHVRQRCVCKPTCSEYAILCLQKYNIIKAVIKIYKRLFKTCGHKGYIIDWP